MSTLTIRKKSLKTWLHTDSVLGDFIISKFYFNADNVSFQIVEQGQSRRVIYNIADITLYALAAGGTAETFTTITQLSLRLEELNYPAFQTDGQITSIANLLEGGDGVDITGDGTEASPYIINLTSGDALFLGSFNSLVALQTAHPVALNGSYAFVSQTGADIVYFFSTDENTWWTVSGGVTSVNTKTGAVVLNQDEILDGTNFKQYSLTEKNKLAGIADGAEVNVNADWNATSGDAQILNKPSIPAAQIQSDWTQANTSALDFIKNKPSITTPNLQQVLLQGDRPLKGIKNDYTIEDADRAKYLLITDKADLTLNFNTIAENSELLIKNSTDNEVNLVVGFAVTIVFNNTEFVGGSSLPIEKGDLFILKQDTNSNFWYLTIVKGIQASIPRLSEVLTESNETDGNNIAISNGDAIILDNGANLKKGTTDAGLGGSKGIALRCAVDYELKWEAGRLYVMGGDGFTIREVSHNFTTTPTVNDDDTKGFVVDSRWILDNGHIYICTDNTTGAAAWEFKGSGNTPSIQEVLTDGGDTAEDSAIYFTNTANDFETSINQSGDGKINLKSVSNDIATSIDAGLIYLGNFSLMDYLIINKDGIIVDSISYPFPSGASSPLATLADITGGGGVPYTGATQDVDLGTHSITAKNLIVTHSSGSGDAATITKGGSGEALKVLKTSGSGNAASITGGVTLLDELHLNTDLVDAYIASASVWNAKQNALSYTPYKNIQTSQTAHTGTTAETVLFTATIPAGTFNSNDVIKVLFGTNKTTGLGTYTLRLRVNTTNTISGAPTIATYNGSASIQANVVMRNYNLNGGNLYGVNFATTAISDIFAGAGVSSTPLNPANQFFIFATVLLSNVGDSIIGNMFSIHN